MKPHAAYVLSLLYPSPELTPSPVGPHRDPQTGRFINPTLPPGFSLSGGQDAPPPARRTAEQVEADHGRLLVELLAPRDLGA
jgi:hypothetical protein